MRGGEMSRNRLPGPSRTPRSDPAVARGPSSPLPAAERAHFESAFGEDFSQVRLHTDAGAGAVAQSLGAKAVASGEDIAFAPGRYEPGSTRGRELLAHELAHVVQQREGGSTGPDGAEPRAQSAARSVTSGAPVSQAALGGAQEGGLYCDEDENKLAPDASSVPAPLLPYRKGFGPPLPPPWLLPPLQPSDPKIDWLSMRQPYESRGVPFTMRDGDDITAEWYRSKALLETFGITEQFKFWFMDQDWLLNAGLNFQLDTINARDHPNAMDRMNRDWEFAKSGQGEWKIPNINFFTKKF